MMRTKYSGAFRLTDIGTPASACGWVSARRDMGGVIFIDLTDREGTLQVVVDLSDVAPDAFRLAETIKNQSVLRAEGIIHRRDEETYNAKIATGEVELRATSLTLLSAADPLPISLQGALGREELRLKYRYLDLRRAEMYKNLAFRHRLTRAAQDFLDAEGFLMVETPMLTKSTPEGARDYLVPSRVHPGAFYALPQSPQIFKQLLMVGQVDRYYQVARCFRDEDLRADRQPEFTQVDMEMSFVDQEELLAHLERMFRSLYASAMGEAYAGDFPRLTWAEAMDRYGSDKPDLRFDLPIVDLTKTLAGCGFSVFDRVIASGGVVRAINCSGCGDFPRTTIEELTLLAQSNGAKGMAWIAWRPDGSIHSILTKYFTDEAFANLLARMDARPGDFILFCADKLDTARRVLGALRLELGDRLHLRPKDQYRFLFVTDFPQFEYSEAEGRHVAMHHPFTMPYPEDLPFLQTDPGRVRAQAYDVVLNGVELGSGSLRIHDPEIQQQMFKALGFSEQEIDERFGFMVEAFRYGTPPHGGFAFGLDRLAMLLLKADSLREVIAFPKLRDASCPMTEAPGPVDSEQLRALKLSAGLDESPARAAEQSDPFSKAAALSKLRFDDDERARFAGELTSIVSFLDDLNAMPLQDVEPTYHVNAAAPALREDRPGPCLPVEELLGLAKATKNGLFIVPKTFE